MAVSPSILPKSPGRSLRIACAPGVEVAWIEELLARHAEILGSGGPRLIQGRRWRPVTQVAVEGREFAVKQYAAGSLGARLRRLLLDSRAHRARENYRHLAAHDVPGAEPVAAIDAPWGGPVESYLITRWVTGSYPRERLRALRMRGDEPGCRKLVTAGGRLLGEMHRRGSWLADFWNQNFLVPEGDPAEPRLVLVDYDDARFRGLTGRHQLRNLRQFSRSFDLHVSAAGRLCFLRVYLAALGLPPERHRPLLPPLLTLLSVASHEGCLDSLCAECWRELRPHLGGARRLGGC